MSFRAAASSTRFWPSGERPDRTSNAVKKPTCPTATLNDDTFVCGCAIGDCHYRTGNIMIRERLEGERNPKLRKTTDKRRVGMFFYTMKDRRTFLDALAQFKAAVSDIQ